MTKEMLRSELLKIAASHLYFGEESTNCKYNLLCEKFFDFLSSREDEIGDMSKMLLDSVELRTHDKYNKVIDYFKAVKKLYNFESATLAEKAISEIGGNLKYSWEK